MTNDQDHNDGTRQPVRCSALLAGDGDPQWKCTVCGRTGAVGRCCGDETRTPLNEAARQEAERIKSANEKLTHGCPPYIGQAKKHYD